MDKKIISRSFDHSLSYDSLKEVYSIGQTEKKTGANSPSLSEAKQIMSEVNDFKIISLADLESGKDYVLRTKVKLAKKTLPLYTLDLIV